MKYQAIYNNAECVTDYAGRFWLVYQSRPTEHGWPVLLGLPVMDDRNDRPRRGGVAFIITRELAAYLKEHRLCQTPLHLRLPISNTVIHRLRRELGINYHTDQEIWWEQARSELVRREEGASPCIAFADSDCPKNWTKEDVRQFLVLKNEGKSLAEIAAEMNKNFRVVDTLHRRLLGIQKPQQAWTEDIIKTLLALKEQGHTHLEISKRLQRSKGAVEGMLMRLLPNRGRAGEWSDEDRKTLVRLSREGASPREIAAKLGRTYHAVLMIRRQLVPVAKKPRWTAEDKKKLQELLAAGLTQREAAARLGRSELSVCQMNHIMKNHETS